ncbi:MAG: acyltransferase family protein [Candidatus Dormibacteria bacterium]
MTFGHAGTQLPDPELKVPRQGAAEPMGDRLGVIDSFRALAAGAVLAFHVVNQSFPVVTRLIDTSERLLASGVILFFVISGFLLFRPFAAAIVTERRFPSVRSFLLNRALRILPAYWVVLTVVVAAIVITGGHVSFNWWALPVFYVLLQNFSSATFEQLIGPAWTLAVEAQFYLFLPLLAVVLWKSRKPAMVGLVLLLLFAGSLAWDAMAFRTTRCWVTQCPALTTMLPSKLYLFIPGMALAWLHVIWHGRAPGLVRRLWPLVVVAGLVLSIGAGYPFRVTQGQTAGAVLFGSVAGGASAIGFALLLGVTVLVRPGLLSRPLEWRGLRFAGEVSYSTYLWHVPIISALALFYAFPARLTLFSLLLVYALSLLVSWASHRLVESPFMRLRRIWWSATAISASR